MKPYLFDVVKTRSDAILAISKFRSGVYDLALLDIRPLGIAYWPEGNALCLFYGSTPISKSPDEILPYSPVDIVGKIITKDDILEEFKDDSTVVIKSE